MSGASRSSAEGIDFRQGGCEFVVSTGDRELYTNNIYRTTSAGRSAQERVCAFPLVMVEVDAYVTLFVAEHRNDKGPLENRLSADAEI